MAHPEEFTWKHIPTPEELKEMHPITRSRFLAYMEPPSSSKQLIHRIIVRMRKERIQRALREQSTLFREHEKEKVNIVIGRLKAAEARQRIHVVLMNLNNKIDKKLDQLVYVQPTGVNAVRTEYLVRNRPLDYLPGGRLNPVKDQKEFYLTLSEKTRLARIMDEKIL